jgi:hypothetical protein
MNTISIILIATEYEPPKRGNGFPEERLPNDVRLLKRALS